jgi:protein involved in polysaccharide export with SLBB domain
MEAGQGRSAWWRPRNVWLGPLLWLPVGCALFRPPIDLAIPTDGGLAARRENRTGAYILRSPDVLDVTVDAHPESTGQRAIGPDGRVDVGAKGRLRVEGCTIGEAAHLLAQVGGVPPAAVHLCVAQYKSQQLYLLGQIAGFQRVVPYQGPETVVDLLHRVGGITAGAAQDDVRVIRSHVAEGRPPDVLRVDLQAILLRHDARTNIYLQPQDQIYVGETREFSLSKCIPPWLRPIYETLCGMRRTSATRGDGVTG